MKKYLILTLIFILAISLRIFYLDKNPIGLYSDEAAFSYNAFSLFKTGRDEFGVLLPLVLKSFGDYKAALYSYYLIPFVSFGDLSIKSVRLGSTFLGILEIIIIYRIVNLIFNNKKLSLLSAFLLSIAPFSLQFNRMVHENNLVLVLISLGLLLFLLSFKKNYYLILSFIMFALSIYTYHDAKVFTPLILVFLTVYYRNQLHKIKKYFFLSIIFFIIILSPLIYVFKYNETWSRPKYTNIFSDKGTILLINQEIGESKLNSFISPRLFHNKVIGFSEKFLENYLKHFSSEYLIFYGDPVKNYNTVGNGILYLFEVPFFYLGLYYLFRSNISHKWYIIFWLIFAPIPAALTKFVPSASRSIIMLPPLIIIISFGLYSFVKKSIAKTTSKFFIQLFIFSIIIINIAYYLHYYYFITPIRYAREWHYGMKEVMDYVSSYQAQYQTIWFTKKSWGYIYPLFFLKYPPHKYQLQANLGQPDEYGFGWIDKFDKYVFRQIPVFFDFSTNILYIIDPNELQYKLNFLKTIYYPDRSPAFAFFDTDIIKRFCPACDLRLKPENVDIYGNRIY